MTITRRQFLTRTAVAGAAYSLWSAAATPADPPPQSLRLGLVTYMWGADWDLPTIIANCAQTGVLGVELRTQHKHGVEPSLTAAERQEVRRRFEDSPVELVGYGSNAQFHENNLAKVAENIELTKAYIKLMHDCGGHGVKVKPNGLVKGVPREKTITQIGQALNVVAAFGADYGQKIRLEIHGQETQRLPIIKEIMDVADHPNVGVCWNSNDADLLDGGLEANFKLVQHRLADTTHIRELNVGSYPYPELFALMRNADYHGWILLECRQSQQDRIAALNEQRRLFEQMIRRS